MIHNTMNGVRYLTEDFLKNTTKQDRLDRVKNINLSRSFNEIPIKFIENLNSLTSLNVLSLNFNIIEKIEKLEKLTNLKELYLKGNKLTKVDGIEFLVKLKILDVSDNKLSSFPYWLTRRCKYLKEINISNNNFDSMEEISKLSPLKDLVILNASGNPVTTVSHYRFCVIVRLKFLQILDTKNITNAERNESIEKFEENDFDKLTAKFIDKEKECEQMKESQKRIEEEHSRQANYQKDLNKKQTDFITRIKCLEEELKNKDSLLKKKSEDLFQTCQKYYELEQDIAFIKIDAKFDILNQNLGSLDAPDDISEHSITGTGDHAYMGKGQFITAKEAQMLQQKRKMRQQSGLRNGHLENEDCDSSQDIKNKLMSSLNDRIKVKMTELEEVNKNIDEQSKQLEKIKIITRRTETSPSCHSTFVEFDRTKMSLPMLSRFSPLRRSLDQSKRKDSHNASPLNITDQFLEKIEHLTEMQKEADELRQQMEVTEKITARQKEDVEYLCKEYEKMKLADPKLAHQIETEMHDKKFEVDQNYKLYKELSNRLDNLSMAIEKAMEDIKEIEEQLVEENQIFTEKMKEDISSALQQLSKSMPSNINNDQKKWSDAYKEVERIRGDLERHCEDQQEEIDHLKLQLNAQAEENEKVRKSKKPLDGEVLILRQDLNRLKEDALIAKEDLESEVEMEKCRNDELFKRIEEMQSNEYELQEQLELISERCREALDEVNINRINLRNTLEQSVAHINESVIEKIRSTMSNPSLVSDSVEPLDIALCELVKSIEIECCKQSERFSPDIRKTIKIETFKDHLDEVDRNHKIGLDHDQKKTSSVDYITKTMKNLPKISEKRSMQNMLSKTCQEYQDDISEVKSQIDYLAETIKDFRAHQKEKNKRKHTKHRMSFGRRRSEETSEEDMTSDGYTQRFKSRAYSQDRISKNKPRHSFSDFRKWKSVEQNVSLDDDLLDEIENELGDLRKQVSSAGSRSTQKFEDAMNYINELEIELQRKDEETIARNLKENKERGNKVMDENLKQTMSEVVQCQEDIKDLHRRLNTNTKFTDEKTSNDFDLQKLKSVLQTQKTEIERLNSMLERLTTQGSHSVPIFGTSSFTQAPFITTDIQPSQMFASAPPQGYFNSQSTPLLNNGKFVNTSVNTANGSDSRLFCNVPEHHYLEDYLNVHPNSHSSLKIKNKFRSESLKCIDKLERLRTDLNERNEELDEVEIKVSKQNGEIERLNYQINQLNLTKQDLLQQLSFLRQETEHETRENIANTSETLGQMRAKKSQLNEEIIRLNTTVTSRREELIHLESEIHACRNQLSQVQGDTTETFQRYEEIRNSHRRLLLECEQLEKRSNDASLELANGLHDLDQIKSEMSLLLSNRANLEGILSKTQEVINQKDEEYQKITEEVNKTMKRLNNLQSDLTMMTEEHRNKIHLISNSDQLLGDTRMELNHLKKEIELNQQHLDRMENEMGEKSASLEITKGELEITRQMNQRSIQDSQAEQGRLKRDITELKSVISECQTERNSFLNDIEGLKIKSTQMKDNIDMQEQILHNHQSEVDRRSWQMQHSDNMLKMKQGQLQQLTSEYNERLADVESLHDEVHQQELESKRIDSDIKRKTVEVEKIRQTIALEHENQLRLQFDKDNLDSSVATSTKERNMLQSQIKELEMDLKNMKKQETQNHESLLSIESRLSQARSEYEKMCSDKCSETIKRDELKQQTNNMAKQLYESKCELQSMRERLTMLDSQCDERTAEVRKKMQLQNNLNIEIRKLQDQIRMVNMSLEETNNQEHNKKDRLSGIDIEIIRKEGELKNLEKKKDDFQNEILKDEKKMEKIIKHSSSELSLLKNELCEKLDTLEMTGSRLQQIRKDVAIKEFTEQKIIELEQIIRQQENTISHYEQEKRRISDHISVLSRDIASLRDNHLFEMENKDKELSTLRKRLSREIFQLEKVAEKHCQRANVLGEDLNQARRDYILLRNRSLAQEHFIEQQNLFKEYIQPAHSRSDMTQTVETAMLTEHRRHLQNQLNLLRDNIASAAHTTTDSLDHKTQENSYTFNKHFTGDRKWYNTSSSGLGSTLEHNASDTSPENDQAKKMLHNQFDEDIEIMHTENARSNDLCRQLRGEVNDLKVGLLTDKSTSASTD